jgi:hypothetical protein
MNDLRKSCAMRRQHVADVQLPRQTPSEFVMPIPVWEAFKQSKEFKELVRLSGPVIVEASQICPTLNSPFGLQCVPATKLIFRRAS